MATYWTGLALRTVRNDLLGDGQAYVWIPKDEPDVAERKLTELREYLREMETPFNERLLDDGEWVKFTLEKENVEGILGERDGGSNQAEASVPRQD